MIWYSCLEGTTLHDLPSNLCKKSFPLGFKNSKYCLTDEEVLADKDLLTRLEVPESGKAIFTDDGDINIYRWVWIKVFPNKGVVKELYESGCIDNDCISAGELAKYIPAEEDS